ncbi:TRAP transporter substrate-binding protein [Vibrio cionasavignyae]|uniref:TRAP transporter substrate-binding protein n=1 Tax=Vibrio cionasavignyae TaxID=2910252 RepID=UPI003D0E6470
MNKKVKLLTTLSTLALSISAFSANALTLRMAHNLAEDHPTSQAMQKFADEVKDRTEGDVKVRLFFNGVLGDERSVVEQVQRGVIDMTRVGAATLETFDPIYSAFTLPYLFDDREHMYTALQGEAGEFVYTQTLETGLKGLTFFDGGERNFYTINKPIMKPEDLRGQKIRVMNSPTAIKMVQLIGGTPTPLAYGEIFTSLQQGVIDGAENNPTALTLGRHGEVAKYYSFDRHNRIPDFVLISTRSWDKLTPEQQEAVQASADVARDFQKELWGEQEALAIEEAKSKMGVQFFYPEIEPFREKVAPLYDEYRENQEIATLLDLIQRK